MLYVCAEYSINNYIIYACMQVVMEFRHPDGRRVPVFLPRRSLIVMSGEARYVWSHGIASRKMDVVHTMMAGYQSTPSSSVAGDSPSTGSTLLSRGMRVSLTFRKIRERPCQCDCSKYNYNDILLVWTFIGRCVLAYRLPSIL